MNIYTIINDNGLRTFTKNGLIDLVVIDFKQNIRTSRQAIEFLKNIGCSVWITELQKGKNN